MPASIAHMVIAHNALTLLKTRGNQGLADFAALLDDPVKDSLCQAYMNLGSIGPDLYYYASMAKSAKEMLLEGFVDAAGVTPWSYHLHSQKPSRFPLHLSEILFQDAVWEGGRIMLDIDDHRKLAYIAGHLSHIAADQIIHPLVNRIAKPYYRSGANRKKHRQCEVYQDYFLYEEVYSGKRDQAKGKKAKAVYSFFDQDFHKWVDCIPQWTTRNTEDWFRYFLQRGFAQTYGVFPSEAEIENSVDNLLLILRICKVSGPYKEAQTEYQKYGADGPMYREYIAEPDYLTYYEQAVHLSAVYMATLYEVYTTLTAGKDFEEQKTRFGKIVSDADLSCPLENDILRKAQETLTSGPGGADYQPLFAQS
jgi:hypothetical protein